MRFMTGSIIHVRGKNIISLYYESTKYPIIFYWAMMHTFVENLINSSGCIEINKGKSFSKFKNPLVM